MERIERIGPLEKKVTSGDEPKQKIEPLLGEVVGNCSNRIHGKPGKHSVTKKEDQIF